MVPPQELQELLAHLWVMGGSGRFGVRQRKARPGEQIRRGESHWQRCRLDPIPEFSTKIVCFLSSDVCQENNWHGSEETQR